ncbi:MAG: hypothetical protein QXJ06_04150 [Candidatus Aenigmatarchaeota archaeon]
MKIIVRLIFVAIVLLAILSFLEEKIEKEKYYFQDKQNSNLLVDILKNPFQDLTNRKDKSHTYSYILNDNIWNNRNEEPISSEEIFCDYYQDLKECRERNTKN